MMASKGGKAVTSTVPPQAIGQSQHAKPRFLRLSDVKAMTGLSKASIYKRMRLQIFPQAIKLGSRLTVWLENDVHSWIMSHAHNKESE